jgi:hypothetical protein
MTHINQAFCFHDACMGAPFVNDSTDSSAPASEPEDSLQ